MKYFMGNLALLILLLVISGLVIEEDRIMPVDGASPKDWHPKSFWYYPWGKSVVHKGIDIFARIGTQVRSSTDGLVLFQGKIARGGNVVLVLGPKWRLHYYAHLQRIDVSTFKPVRAGEALGSVGDSGNAKGKPPHLHYSIKSLYPRFWTINKDKHRPWQRVFFIDPGKFLTSSRKS